MREQFVKVEIRVCLVSTLLAHSLSFNVSKVKRFIMRRQMCLENYVSYIDYLIFALSRFNFNFLNIYKMKNDALKIFV